MSEPSHYRHHVFFCCNQRAPGERTCCADKGASALRDYAKQRVKTLGVAGPQNVRVNMAGCLDRCEQGPCVVVYPDAVWYRYVDEEDIDEIIDRHLVGGEIVERLRIPAGPTGTDDCRMIDSQDGGVDVQR